VKVVWPSMLSRDREGLHTWLVTRKAESDKKLAEREHNIWLSRTYSTSSDGSTSANELLQSAAIISARVPTTIAEEIKDAVEKSTDEVAREFDYFKDIVQTGLQKASEEEKKLEDSFMSWIHGNCEQNESSAPNMAQTTIPTDLQQFLMSAWEDVKEVDTPVAMETVKPGHAEGQEDDESSSNTVDEIVSEGDASIVTLTDFEEYDDFSDMKHELCQWISHI